MESRDEAAGPTRHTGASGSYIRSVVVSLVSGVCLLALTIVSKYALDVELDFASQFAPVWVYCAYLGTRVRDRQPHTVLWTLTTVVVTAAVLLVHAF